MNSNFLISAFRKLTRRPAPGPTATGVEEALQEADLLQEAFLKLWSAESDADSEAHAEGMLLTTMRNLRIDTLRRRRTVTISQIETLDTEVTDDYDSDTSELYVRVTAMMDSLLSARDREILFHREHDAWEFAELADHYGLTEANIRMIVARGRRKVLAALMNRDNKPSPSDPKKDINDHAR